MKKVLSFVLVLALVLGSFSMAFAAPESNILSDVAGNANEAAINVASDFGIITGYPDGTFKPAQEVNRAEFAAMITRALSVPASALAGYTATAFNDVAGYTWAVPYLAFCEAKGIMLGDGNGNAMPGRTININEAITMVLRAVGYTNDAAVLVGNWPSNYVSLAQDLELYTNVAATATVDRANAAQIIYNALTLAKVGINKDGTDIATGATMLSVLGAATAPAIIVDSSTQDSAKIDVTPYIGAQVVPYMKDGKIVAIDEVKTVFVTGTYDSAKSKFTTTDKVEYKLVSTGAVTTGAVKYLNGLTTGTATDAYTTIMSDEDLTYTLAVKLSADKKEIVTVYSVAYWDVTTVAAISAANVKSIAKNEAAFLGSNFPMTSDGKAIDATKVELVGVDSLAKIAAKDVVFVYANPANKITKIEVTNKTVTGTITKIETIDGTTNYAIDGVNYVMNEDTANAVPVIGKTGTATLDPNGDIFKWTNSTVSADKYAIVLASKVTNAAVDSNAWTDASVTAASDCAVKLFTAEGQTITAGLTSTQAMATNVTVPATLVKYSLNDKGDIATIAAVATTQTTGKVLANGTLINTKAVASDVIIFVSGSAAWKVGKMADFDTKKDITVAAITNSANAISVIVVTDSACFPTTAVDSTYGLVTKNDTTAYVNSKTVQQINILLDGAAKDALNCSGTAVSTTVVGSAQELQEIVINSDGIVTKATNASVTSIAAATITAVNGNLVTLDASATYQIADNAVIYVWNADKSAWTVVALEDLATLVDADNVKLYNTKADDKSAGYEIIIVR